MNFRRIILFLSITLFILTRGSISAQSGSTLDTDSGVDLRVTAVQFSVNDNFYKSVEDFSDKINSIVGEEMRVHDPDLIIFPEYTSVFIALIPFIQELNSAKNYTNAFEILKKEYPDIKTVKDLFLKESGYVFTIMKSIFGRLGAKYHVYILAGTYFASSMNTDNKLYNRSVVFGPKGSEVYYQNKVFLTDFEKYIIGLSSGELKKTDGFSIKKKRIALSICRDTYEKVWEEKFKNYDLWIDIKANGTGYDEQQKQSFLRALPGRIINTNVKYGITDCLTGKLFDLYWEGESSLIKNNGRSLSVIKKSKGYNDEETMFLILRF